MLPFTLVLFSVFSDDDSDDEPNAHNTCDVALLLVKESIEFDAMEPIL